jgi:hypothetical protein
MSQPKYVVLDTERTVERFRDYICDLITHCDLVVQVLSSVCECLGQQETSNVCVNLLIEDVLTVYNIQKDSLHAKAVTKGIWELTDSVLAQVQLHGLFDHDGLSYSFHGMQGSNVVLASTLKEKGDGTSKNHHLELAA